MMKRVAFLIFLTAISLSGFAFQSAPTIKLTSSENPGIAEQAITFTATVSGMPGMPTPTGTVTFADSGTALYSPVILNSSGSATFVTSSLSAATHSITAEYSGDVHYSGATSAVLSEEIVPAPTSDYTFTAVTTTQSVTAGDPATYTLTVTPTNGYNGTVTFSCAALPTGSSCSFDPISVTPNSTGDAVTTVLTVTTTATTSQRISPDRPQKNSGRQKFLASLSLAGLLGVVFLCGRGGKAKKIRFGGAGMLVCGALILLGGCGGGSSASTTGTPIGTDTFTVNAVGTAGTNGGNTATQQLSLTLTVTSPT